MTPLRCLCPAVPHTLCNVQSVRSVTAELVLAHGRAASAAAWYQAPRSGFGLDTDSPVSLGKSFPFLCTCFHSPPLIVCLVSCELFRTQPVLLRAHAAPGTMQPCLGWGLRCWSSTKQKVCPDGRAGCPDVLPCKHV